MIRRSVVGRLWITIVALFAVTMAILFSSVTTVVTGFYVRMRIDEMDRHADEISRMVQTQGINAGSVGMVDLVAAMSESMVMVVGKTGDILVCSTDTPIVERDHIPTLKDINVALAGKQSWSLTDDPFTRQPALSLALPLQYSGQPAAIVFLAPAGPMQQTIMALERVLLILATIGVALITVLAFFLSRRLSRPLLHMTAAASEMAAGDFSRRIQVLGDDEVGQLGRSMNNMSERLESTLTTLASERDQVTALLARERHLVEVQKEFVANVSHELRTPLTYLQGYTEAILDGLARPDDQRRYLQIILDECQRLRRLVADLLDLTVIESKQAPLRPERVPAAGLIEDAAMSLQPIASTKGVTITVPRPGTADIDVWVDPDRSKQVLVNLIDNAIRYAPSGSAVSIETWQPDDTDQLWIAITNQGPDIPDEVLPHVWDRFFKEDRARRRDSSGTGLGLPIARGIVEAQGGHVRVTSGDGKGTTFAFSVPLYTGAGPARREPPERQ